MKIKYGTSIKTMVKKLKEYPNLFDRVVIFLVLGLCAVSGVLLLLNYLSWINTPRIAQTAIMMSVITSILILGIKDLMRQLSHQKSTKTHPGINSKNISE